VALPPSQRKSRAAQAPGTGVTDDQNDIIHRRLRGRPGNDPEWAYTGDDRNMLFSATFSSAGAVPEPSTWALMILGFGAIAGTMRRRKRVSATVRYA